ncbi:hypothetical protein Tco_1104096 [Tanacetum coccineum]
MTDKYCPRGEIRNWIVEMWNLKGEGQCVDGWTSQNMQDAIEFPLNSMDKKINIGDGTQADNKNATDLVISSCTLQLPQNVTIGSNQGERLLECGAQGHFKKDCLKLKNNNNRGNQVGNAKARAKVYAVGNAGANPDNNVITAQEYLTKGCPFILENITATKNGRQVKGETLEMCQLLDFPEVFPAGLARIEARKAKEHKKEDVEELVTMLWLLKDRPTSPPMLAMFDLLLRSRSEHQETIGFVSTTEIPQWEVGTISRWICHESLPKCQMVMILLGDVHRLTKSAIFMTNEAMDSMDKTWLRNVPKEGSTIVSLYPLEEIVYMRSLVVPLEGLQVDDKLHFVKSLYKSWDAKIKQLRRIRFQWSRFDGTLGAGQEFTLGREDQFRKEISTPLHLRLPPSSSAVS